MTAIIRMIIIALVLTAGGACLAQDRRIIDIVLPQDNPTFRQISAQIADQQSLAVNTYIAEPPSIRQRGDILVFVGDGLLPLLRSESYDAIFALYVNSQSFVQQQPCDRCTAVFSDPPMSVQLSLIQALFPEQSRRVGIAYSNEAVTAEINRLRQQQAYKIDAQHVAESDSPRAINRMMRSNDVILGIADKRLYNSQSIRSVLLGSYRQRTPLIGPNADFVRAGALASVTYTSPQFLSAINAMIEHFIDSGELPAAQTPADFDVAINYSVAQALGLVLPDEAQIKRRMMEH